MDPDRARELLQAERRRIERGLADLGRDEGASQDEDLDAGDQATDLYQDELDESREDDLREQLAAVERAEDRLVVGTYGLSVESGEPILDERLEAFPTAERTAAEQERFDRGSGGP
jgi:RNA polymerase-binding transcription factor